MVCHSFMSSMFLWYTGTSEIALTGGKVVEVSGKRMPRRVFGKTGAEISIIGLGGMTVLDATQEETDEIVHYALDHGVNYFDVAPSYGHAEEVYGPALEGHRDDIFLACKTLERTKDGAAGELRRSLTRLRTDHLDLYQLHAVCTIDEVEQVFAPGGAMEAFLDAREKGIVRHIGFTSHSVEAALAAIARFDFDTVMFPISWICYYHGHLGPQVVEAARAKGMGIAGIKSAAPLRRIEQVESTAQNFPARSDEELTAMGLRFALAEPISAVLPRGHVPTFKLAVSVAERLTKLSEAEQEELAARSADFKPIFEYVSGCTRDNR